MVLYSHLRSYSIISEQTREFRAVSCVSNEYSPGRHAWCVQTNNSFIKYINCKMYQPLHSLAVPIIMTT